MIRFCSPAPRLLGEYKLGRELVYFLSECVFRSERFPAYRQRAAASRPHTSRPPYAPIRDINHGKHTFPFRKMLKAKSICFDRNVVDK